MSTRKHTPPVTASARRRQRQARTVAILAAFVTLVGVAAPLASAVR